MLISHELTPHEVDCLVLGAGITGAGVARDAAMRGLRVLVVDSHDFASGTSHLTSKLIHGGLRYLEHGHVRPVVEGIIERDRLLNRLAPNLVTSMRFFMPFEWRRFPSWFACVFALQFYGLTDWLCGRGWSGGLLAPGLKRHCPHIKHFPLSILFRDAQTNDARLVLSTLRTAAVEGAVLWNYTKVDSAGFERGAWTVDLRCDQRDRRWTVRAKTIVNATGPWSPITAERLGSRRHELLWIKGSHILLRRSEAFGHDAIIIRSVRNGRPLWAVPWGQRLLLGSTESRYTGDLRAARPTKEEIDDLFESFVDYFPRLGTKRSDIRCAFAGVRPIVSQEGISENSLSRRHRIDADTDRRLITTNGGKLTTFRLMAEQTVDEVCRMLGGRPTSFSCRHRLRYEPLWPRLDAVRLDELTSSLRVTAEEIGVGSEIVDHLVRHYGADAGQVIDAMQSDKMMARPIAAGLPFTVGELMYLCRHERVCHLVDLLKRRTSVYFQADCAAFPALPALVERIAPLLGWDARRREAELASVANELRGDLGEAGGDVLDALEEAALSACA